MGKTITAGEVISLVAFVKETLGESLPHLSSRRTAIQKIIYLALSPEERDILYEIGPWGPYSNSVQGAIIGLERGDFSHETANWCPEKWKCSVRRVVDRLKRYSATNVQDLVILAKVYYLSENGKIFDSNTIKRKAALLHWNDILHLSDEEIYSKANIIKVLQNL